MTPEERLRVQRAGQERKRLHLQQSANDAVIVAARARGWTLKQIACAAGVSWQRIEQRIARHERRFGPIEPIARGERRRRSIAAKHLWKCAACGKSGWAMQKQLHDGRHFCSSRCRNAFQRRIDDEMIERAIRLRVAGGRSWASIAMELGYPVQSLQARIWKFLYQAGRLDWQTVQSIWGQGDYPSSWA